MKLKLSYTVRNFLVLYSCVIIGTIAYYISHNSLISFVIILIGLLFGLGKAFKQDRLMLWLMMMLAYDFWGLVPMINIGEGILHWYDVGAAVAVGYFLKYIGRYKPYRFRWVYYFQFVFIGIACYQSFAIYGQSVLTTIATARGMFAALGFWPIVYAIKTQRITKKEFIDTIVRFAKVTILFAWIGWITENLGFDTVFIQTGVRFGVRIYVNVIMVLLLYFFNLYQILYKNIDNAKNNIVSMLICVATIAVVTQLRTVIAMTGLTTVIMLLMTKNIKKAIMISIPALIVLIILLSLPMTQLIIQVTLDEIGGGNKGAVAIRNPISTYFNNKLEGHQLFGVGIPNNHYGDAVYYSGQYIDVLHKKNNYYYLTDMGNYAIRYQFGILAYVGYYVAVVLGIKRGIKYRNSSVFAFLGASILLMQNIGALYKSWMSFAYIITRPFDFMLIVVLLEIVSIEDNASIKRSMNKELP